ncbi:PDZ domain-containing protein [bacterium]|nr:PDZ domain-containing protein [bacterium]
MRTMWRLATLFLVPLAAFGWSSADLIETKQAERLQGRIVRENPKQLVLRTPYGELTLPRTAIKKHTRATYVVELKNGSKLEGQVAGEADGSLALNVGGKPRQVPLADVKSVTEKQPPARPKVLSPQEFLKLHRAVLAHFEKKDYAAALATCEKILKSLPDEATTLYNAACACARRGDKPKALDYLRKAVEAGFLDFVHIEKDPDLESLRAEAAYRELFAKKAEYIERVSKKTIERLSAELKKKGIATKQYRSLFDRERNFVYFHPKSDEEIAAIRRSLEAYADCQWRDLFQNKPQRPLFIVLLTAADSPKVFRRGIGGMFNPAAMTLFCSDMPAHKLLRMSVVIHEFTHALHHADMGARHQRHPIWLVEGLATLFESADRNGTVVPRHNHRLAFAQQAAREGRLLSWAALMKLNHVQFMLRAQLAYAQARYMLFYMHEKGLLKRFYDEYTARENYAKDRSAIDSFQVVFGKPIEEVERDWRAWLLEQQVPPVPFLGVQTEDKDGQVVVVKVVPGAPAAKAGIQAKDRLVALGGQPLGSRGDLLEAVATCKVGEDTEVELLRGDRKLTVKVKLTRRPGTTPRTPHAPPYLGLTVQQQDGAVVIKEVAPDSPAQKAGLKAGAALLEFGGKKQTSVRGFLAALRGKKPGQKIPVKTKLGDDTRTVTVELAPQPAPR